MRVASTVLTSLLLISTSCVTGRMTVQPVDLEDIAKAPRGSALRLGVLSLARADSSFYQDTLEREIVRSLRASGLFASVMRDKFEANDVDLVLQFRKADTSFRHHANLAGLPLSVLTLGIYMLVGAPLWTHEEFYEIPARVEVPEKGVGFDVVSKTKESHWLGLWSHEILSRTVMCPAPHVSVAINDFVRDLAASLQEHRLVGASSTAAGRMAQVDPEDPTR